MGQTDEKSTNQFHLAKLMNMQGVPLELAHDRSQGDSNLSFAAGWLSWVDSTSLPDVIKGVEHCLLTDKFLSDLSALRSAHTHTSKIQDGFI